MAFHLQDPVIVEAELIVMDHIGSLPLQHHGAEDEEEGQDILENKGNSPETLAFCRQSEGAFQYQGWLEGGAVQGGNQTGYQGEQEGGCSAQAQDGHIAARSHITGKEVGPLRPAKRLHGKNTQQEGEANNRYCAK